MVQLADSWAKKILYLSYDAYLRVHYNIVSHIWTHFKLLVWILCLQMELIFSKITAMHSQNCLFSS